MEAVKKQTFTQKITQKAKDASGVNPKDSKLTLTLLFVSFIALSIGGVFGVLQVFERAGYITLPSWFNYYQVLTSHGFLLVLVFTTTFMIGMGDSTVLYTFYPPMQASPWFYIGLVFLVLGIWIAAFGVFINVANWRKRNPGQHIPIFSFFATGIFVLLFFGTLGVTYEV